MCNIYKNNLSVLSNLDNNQLLYYSNTTSELKIDDRYFGYFQGKTDEKNIVYIINHSFMRIINNYIINISSHENYNQGQDTDVLQEIKNTKSLLQKALTGLQRYQQNLSEPNQGGHHILELYQNISNMVENIDNLREEYICKINTKLKIESPSWTQWLSKLYKDSSHKVSPIIKEPTRTNSEVSEDSESTETCEVPIDCETLEETESYVFGFIYILGNKIKNIITCAGKHVIYFFRH